MVVAVLKEERKYASMDTGLQCVMISGHIKMLKWFVNSLSFHTQVYTDDVI